MRVKVYDGEGKKFLGYGEYVGKVKVFAIRLANGMLTSCQDAEQEPPQELLDSLQEKGGELIEIEDNPKIRMDDGRTLYGVQVWWEPV